MSGIYRKTLQTAEFILGLMMMRQFIQNMLTRGKTGEESFLFFLSFFPVFSQHILWSLHLSSISLKEASVNILLKIIQLHQF